MTKRLSSEPVRVYLRGGKVAHLLPPYSSPNSYDSSHCGRSPEWLSYWLGTGSQREYDYVATLPTCKICERIK